MRIIGFIWLDQVVDKLNVKHGVDASEVEEVLYGDSLKVRRMNRGNYKDEDVYRALGQTTAGRYLAVFFIYKKTGEALTLSAREMDPKERRSYGKI